MKTRVILFLFVLAAFCVGALFGAGVLYVRSDYPDAWNNFLKMCEAPSQVASTQQVVSSNVSITPAQAAPETAPAPISYSRPAKLIPADATVDTVTPIAPAPSPAPLIYHPPKQLPAKDNWTWTVDGREFHNVVISRVDADSVSILYAGGAGSIDLAKLDTDLQHQLNYDPRLAAQSVEQKNARWAEGERQAEAQRLAEVDQKKKQGEIEEQQRQKTRAEDAAKENAAVRLDDMAIKQRALYADDLAAMNYSVVIDPTTNEPVNTKGPVYSRKYQEDLAGIAKCDAIIAANGKVASDSQ